MDIDSVNKEFGQLLRQLRQERNLSQDQLAKLSGLSRPFITRLENGDRHPSLCTIVQLSKAFNIKASTLVKKLEVLIIK